MIVVKVELWSAVTGQKTELARMTISNVGGSHNFRDYEVCTYRGRSSESLDRSMRNRTITRKSKVLGHPSLKLHVWFLVAKALRLMGYSSPHPSDSNNPDEPSLELEDSLKEATNESDL